MTGLSLSSVSDGGITRELNTSVEVRVRWFPDGRRVEDSRNKCNMTHQSPHNTVLSNSGTGFLRGPFGEWTLTSLNQRESHITADGVFCTDYLHPICDNQINQIIYTGLLF